MSEDWGNKFFEDLKMNECNCKNTVTECTDADNCKVVKRMNEALSRHTPDVQAARDEKPLSAEMRQRTRFDDADGFFHTDTDVVRNWASKVESLEKRLAAAEAENERLKSSIISGNGETAIPPLP